MQVELTVVLPVEKETLRNLLEKYNYEFSQYDLIPFNEEGCTDTATWTATSPSRTGRPGSSGRTGIWRGLCW